MSRKSLNPKAMLFRFSIRCLGVIFPLMFVGGAYALFFQPHPVRDAVEATKTQTSELHTAGSEKVAEVKQKAADGWEQHKDNQAGRKARLTAYSDCVKAHNYQLEACKNLDPKAGDQ